MQSATEPLKAHHISFVGTKFQHFRHVQSLHIGTRRWVVWAQGPLVAVFVFDLNLPTLPVTIYRWKVYGLGSLCDAFGYAWIQINMFLCFGEWSAVVDARTQKAVLAELRHYWRFPFVLSCLESSFAEHLSSIVFLAFLCFSMRSKRCEVNDFSVSRETEIPSFGMAVQSRSPCHTYSNSNSI